tara:strand:+ start:2142 stop:2474 length:333 start_codon:yes stop_codon:yes gene_type:complete
MEETNKLIAEFMGYEDWSEYSSVRLKRPDGIDAYKHICKYKDLQYHESWDWLHKVLDKIEDECILRQRMADNLQSSGHLWFTSGYLYQCGTITEVYEAVVEFIKFYNQNK